MNINSAEVEAWLRRNIPVGMNSEETMEWTLAQLKRIQRNKHEMTELKKSLASCRATLAQREKELLRGISEVQEECLHEHIFINTCEICDKEVSK